MKRCGLLLLFLTGCMVQATERPATILYHPFIYHNARHASPAKGCGGCTVAQRAELDASWSYVWGPNTAPGVLPLVKPHYHQAWEAQESAEREGWLLWANEPDLEGPTPQEAAALYPQAEALDTRLVLSVGSQLDESQEWAKAFRQAYHAQWGTWPRIDALAAHCYHGPESVGWCIGHVENVVQLAQSWGVEQTWVTEFACAPMTARSCYPAAEAFIGWMEENVNRYAWFAARWEPNWPEPLAPGALFNQDGLTVVGRWFRGVP